MNTTTAPKAPKPIALNAPAPARCPKPPKQITSTATTAQHTLGPWKTNENASGDIWIQKGEWFIASMMGKDQHANAKLIAVAPELLDFAKAFIKWSEKAPLNAAIAKGQLYGHALRIVEKATL